MALERGQRQVLASLAAVVAMVGVVTAAVLLLHHGGHHDRLTTAGRTSTSTSTATPLADGATASSSSTSSTARDASSTTTAPGSSTSTTAKGKAKSAGSSSSTTAKAKASGGGGGAGTTTSTSATILVPAGPCSTGGSSQADQIANLYCAYRRNNGEAAMSRNSALDGVAQKWAQKLADDAGSGRDPNSVLAHDLASNPEATYPGGYPAAVKADCSHCTGWAENVAYDTSANGAWQAWLGDAGHRDNIQRGADGGEFGVGAAFDGTYWWYVQDFGFYP